MSLRLLRSAPKLNKRPAVADEYTSCDVSETRPVRLEAARQSKVKRNVIEQCCCINPNYDRRNVWFPILKPH